MTTLNRTVQPLGGAHDFRRTYGRPVTRVQTVRHHLIAFNTPTENNVSGFIDSSRRVHKRCLVDRDLENKITHCA